MIGQAYEEVPIHSATAGKSFALFVRKDIQGLFQELYDKLGEVRAQAGLCACAHVAALIDQIDGIWPAAAGIAPLLRALYSWCRALLFLMCMCVHGDHHACDPWGAAEQGPDLRPVVVTVDGARQINGFSSADWLARQQVIHQLAVTCPAQSMHHALRLRALVAVVRSPPRTLDA